MDRLYITVHLHGELDVVEALVADHVGVVVGVEDLHLDLHLVTEELGFDLGTFKLALDVINNNGVTLELDLLGGGEFAVLFDIEVAVMALGEHGGGEGLVGTVEEPISGEPGVLEVGHGFNSLGAETLLE